MSEAGFVFHSPLSLLREWQTNTDAPLREVLVTGYTLDLVFFERHCVSLGRDLGARVTVLADAGQAVHDPVDVRLAGRAYQHGHARCAAAFHPKLVVLVGDEEVWAAIGSGNPTQAGWGHNHELWLIVRSARRQGPAALRDLGTWLSDLTEVVAMPSWIADTVRRVGQAVTPVEVDDSLPELRIFGNLRRSLLTQLPDREVDALRLAAPFFDARAAAIRALVTRFRPDEVDLAIQPNLSQYDGAAVADAVRQVSTVGVRLLPEKRTSHGKLVEWAVGESVTAMVGSANLSAAAMLASTVAGGNCELAATYPVEASLMPSEGTNAALSTIQTTNTIPTDQREPSGPELVLLGARQLPGRIVVELFTTAPGPVAIEMSQDGTPGTWQPVHVAQKPDRERTTEEFPVPAEWGGAVRARAGQSGDSVVSSVVFLTDTARCRPRDDDERPRLTRDVPPPELFADRVLANRFHNDLLRLISQTAEHRTNVTDAGHRANESATDDHDDDRYGTWVRSVERMLGPSLTELVLPDILRPAALATAAPGWNIGPQADEAELAMGENDDITTDTPMSADPDVPATPTVPPSEHQQWRLRARRLCHAASGQPLPPIELRMTVVRLYLDLLAAGVWQTDHSWRSELSELTQVLPPTDEEYQNLPGPAVDFANSLTAICVALLLQDATLSGTDEYDRIARTAWQQTRNWIAFADPSLVAGYLYQPNAEHARVAGEAEITSLIEFATDAEDDPDALLRMAFQNADIPATRLDGAWVVDGEFRNPRRFAARTATIAGSPCVVLARNKTRSTIIVFDDHTVAVAESAVRRWRVYPLGPASTPLSLLGGDDGLPTTREQHPLLPVPQQIQEMATHAGVNTVLLAAALK